MNYPKAYYNEIDPFSCAWLQKLMDRGLIMPGTIDNRSIEDVNPEDLAGYTRVGFFAGIGGWDLALQLAGWPEDKPIWHGSCPCQPFSSAGKGGGFADERHLWPAFHHLIRVCRPDVVVGEQVASPDGLRWCDLVQNDLEMEGYAFGKADLCAAGVGAPHIRQRLYWVAHSTEQRWFWRRSGEESHGGDSPREQSQRLRDAGRLAHDQGSGRGEERQDGRGCGGGNGSQGLPTGPVHGCDTGRLGVPHSPGRQQGQPTPSPMGHGSPIEPAGGALGLAHPDHQGPQGRILGRNSPGECAPGEGCVELQGVPNPLHSFWKDADWLLCRDGKWRPVEPGSFPLAHGVSNRVGRLRGYGNAIVPQVAAEFLKAALSLP